MPQKNYRNLLLGYFEEKETLMRNMKMALVVLAVLAMAGTSFAGLEVSVVQQADPSPGYWSYLVSAGGVDTFVNINIDGTVVQANKFEETFLDPPAPAWAAIPTVWGPPAMPVSMKAMDTHFMFAKPSLVLGNTGNETNNAYDNPDAPTSIIPVASSFYAGLGTFKSDAGSAFTFNGAPAVGTPFMQIVIPAQTGVMLTGTTNGGGRIEQWVGVPEPGTIALLIAGALCLVVARFRK